MKKTKLHMILSSIVVLLPVIFVLLFGDRLSAVVPIHFGITGQADNFASVKFAFITIVSILAVLHWLCVFITLKDRGNKEQNPKILSLVMWIVPTIALFMSMMMLMTAMGKYDSIFSGICLFLGICLILMGNYLPKCKQNWFIGIKIKWTLENEENWNYFTAGKGDDVDVEQLRAVYDKTETYADGIGAYLEAAGEKFPVPEDQPQSDSWDETEYLVFDEGELLSDSEERALTEKLLKSGHTYNTQLTVCTTKTLDGADIDAYADGLYDYMQFGYGSEKAGVMVLVCMEPRQVCVFSNASITADDRTAIREAITPYLSDGEYAEAFDKFAEEAEYYISGNQNGFPFDFMGTLATCLIIGIVAGLIVAFVLKGQLKSVRKQNRANNYVKPGSMQVTIENDFFLYRTISRTRKSSNSSSGGSSSRGSSSGSF